MSRGKKLSRQISRQLGTETIDADIPLMLDRLRCLPPESMPPHLLSIIEKIPAFLDAIDFSYAKYEENMAMADRTVAISSKELVEINRSINSMVNSLGQGFLMFDAHGICGPVYSMACQTLLETMPAGKSIATILRLEADRAVTFSGLLRLLFMDGHAMSFEEVMHFAPGMYTTSEGASIKLDYKPDYTTSGKLDRVILIATDISNEVQAQVLADQRKAMFESIERALRDRRSFGAFISHVQEFIATCGPDGRAWDRTTLLREVHTLKAGAGMYRLMPLMNAFHEMETAIASCDGLLPGKMEVPEAHRQDLLHETDIVIHRFQELLGIDVFKLEEESFIDRQKLYNFARYLESHGDKELQQAYLRQVCAESLVGHLRSFDLLLDDLANRLNKKIKPIRFYGDDVPILTDNYRGLFESLTHVFRNIMDHGIEFGAIRLKHGKDEEGFIKIKTSLVTEDGQAFLTLDIEDDGAGIDLAKIRTRLHERDPEAGWHVRKEQDVLDGMLHHTLSTSDTVTTTSGRGLGLNAVNQEINKLGGRMRMTTISGKGTAFSLRVPYRLAITP